MALSSLSPHELLHKLSKDPESKKMLYDTTVRIRDSSHNQSLAQAIGHVAGAKPPTWVNCIGQQLWQSRMILYPISIEALVSAVNGANNHGLSLRAVGSGHLFSDVAPSADGNVLLGPPSMNEVPNIETSLLHDTKFGDFLFSIESEFTVQALNEALDSESKGLINMGAYDSQTLAGAISTGTHRTRILLGPIASSVRSLVLVSEKGMIYHIEPTNGITDPAAFANAKPVVILKQDDDWFQSSVVPMGCMGLVYFYTLEVLPAYLLRDKRTFDTWEALKIRQGAGSIPQLLRDHRHFEVDINPYAVGGNHLSTNIVRNIDNATPKG